MQCKIQMFVEADTVAELHAKVLEMLGKAREIPGVKSNTTILPEIQPTKETLTNLTNEAIAKVEEIEPTAEVVPMAERKKPGRPKKTETVVEAEPAKEPAVTVEDARAVLSDIKSKIGMEEARQLNKKHGEQALNDKTPEQWGAIVAEGKVLLAALEE